MDTALSLIQQLVADSDVSSSVVVRYWASDFQGFQTMIRGWIIESIEKNGTLDGTTWPSVLRSHIDKSAIVDLYTSVVGVAARLELEWRASFVNGFAINDADLPSLDIGQALTFYGIILLRYIATGDPVSGADVISHGFSCGLPMSELFYTRDELDAAGIRTTSTTTQLGVADLAQGLGLTEIVSVLAK